MRPPFAAAAAPAPRRAARRRAAGELNIFNWGDYTSPELIKKFEQQYDIKVTITDYDSQRHRDGQGQGRWPRLRHRGADLDRVPDLDPRGAAAGEPARTRWPTSRTWTRAGSTSPSIPAATIPSRGRSGTTGVVVNTKFYQGDPNTWAIVFDPPPELAGKINVVPEMNDIVNGAIMYVGGTPCTDDKAVLKKARDVLMAAKPKWASMNYASPEFTPRGTSPRGANWNGYTFRARLLEPGHQVRLPQGRLPDLDGQRGHPEGREERRERQAVLELHHGPGERSHALGLRPLPNGIKGSEKYMPADMQGAPELTLPEPNKGVFLHTCPPEVNDIMTKIWTEVQK